MKERPILFQGAMVRALLAGTKTQTRRVMTRQKKHDFTDYTLFGQRWHADDEAARRGGWAEPWVAIEHAPDWPDGKEDQCTCPYASHRGDQLWVRETHARNENQLSETRVDTSWVYRADGEDRALDNGGPKPWTPAIHMPRAASRIQLEVTDLRMERLQDISEADCAAEGIAAFFRGRSRFDKPAMTDQMILEMVVGVLGSVRAGYADLWNSINGPGSWDANPWVWVVVFKRIKP